jgi:ABC-type branched-subunit amino acid transport system permease subunit
MRGATRFPYAPLLYGLVGGVILGALTLLLPSYARFIAGQLAVLIIITLGVNLLLGVAGLLSLASPAFVGIGANVMTIMLIHAGVPVLIAIPVTVGVGMAVGWVLGLVSLRLAGFYLAMVTFGFLNVFLVLLNQGGDLTGGGYGLIVPLITLPIVGRVTVDTVIVVSVFFAVLCAVLVAVSMRSRIGRAWIAVKDNPVAAELQGIDPALLKTQAFAISSGLATLAGTLQALLLGVTNPSAYSLNVSIAHLTYAVVGGMSASVIGPIVGPLVLFVVPEVFRALGPFREVFYGGVLLLTIIVAPQGLGGLLTALVRRLRRPSGVRG